MKYEHLTIVIEFDISSYIISFDDSVFTKTHKHRLPQSLYTTTPITFYECNLQCSLLQDTH